MPAPLIWGCVMFGFAVRVWMAGSPLGRIDGDDAVVGLMALRLADGELPAYYWGQAHGGSIEPLLAAALFAVSGATPFALKLATVTWSALAAYLTYLVGRPLVGEAAARVGALLFWVAPAAFLYWSTRAGSYWASLCLALLALLALVRAPAAGRWSCWRVGAIGLLVGVCWWANPQTGYLVLPAALVYWRRLVRQWRCAPAGVVGVVVGALPGLVWNLRHDWGSLDAPAGAAGVEYLDRLRGFFEVVLPSALGLRAAFSHDWVPAGRLFFAVLLVAFGVGLIRWRRDRGVLFAVAVVYPFLYAISPLAWFVAHPRYALFLWPVAALLIGALVGPRRLLATALVVVAAFVSVAQARDLEKGGTTVAPAYGIPVPDRFDDLKRLVEEEKIRFAFSDYWIAYRATFEMEERVIVTPLFAVRYQPYDRQVRASPAPAYVLLTRSPAYDRFKTAVSARGIPLRTVERGDFALAIPARRTLPEELGWEWLFG